MTKYISVLGSTGSIGTNTLKVARHLGKEKIKITALAAHSNIDLVEVQAKEFEPDLIAIYDEKKAKELSKRLPNIPVVSGIEGVVAAATCQKADLVLSAIAGTLGLLPTAKALEAKKTVALANKEALVSGGSLMISLAKKNGVKIIPVDSEHSAIFQCLNGEDKKEVDRIILTSSGGPFRNYSMQELLNIDVKDALNHPTWSMGPKVTVDSSTLMNKGLEVIEAYWLFGLSVDKIDVVIHPQSVIHSMVEYIDGSMIAQMSRPTMLVPIQYALTYPQREKGLIERHNFSLYDKLEFYQPDLKKFRCLQLAFDCLSEGGSMACYMNAANEILVKKFLDGKIAWTQIAEKLENLLLKHQKKQVEEIGDVLEIDKIARIEAEQVK